ncbi:MAG: T9SS type B sorting domain-containing protein, partial [Bacteroidota bacterium]
SAVIANPPDDNLFYVTVTNTCGSTLDSILVQTIEAQIQAGNDTIICPNETANLWASGAITYQWNPFATFIELSGNEVEVSPSQSTNYQVIGTDANGCKDTAFVLVQLFPYPSLIVTSDVFAFYGEEIQLSATSNTPGNFTWYPPTALSCSDCSNPVASPNQDITYFVNFEDTNGCYTGAWVNIYYDALVYVPNTFIPDDDDKNDVFQIYGSNIYEMECLIFNRWGELICTLNSMTDSWDGTYQGKKCPDGTYTWKLTITDFQNRHKQIIGHINLLR